MGLSTHFKATINNISLPEFIAGLTALTGRNVLLRSRTGDFIDPVHKFFTDNPIGYPGAIFSGIPYGRYTIVDPFCPDVHYTIEAQKDTIEDKNIASNDRIKIFDFTDNPYQESDFKLLKDLCYHVGYSSYEITDEFTGKTYSEQFEINSVAYNREMRRETDIYTDVISRILCNLDNMKLISLSDMAEVDTVFDKIVEDRKATVRQIYKADPKRAEREANFVPQLFAERIIVKGYVASDLDKDTFAKYWGGKASSSNIKTEEVLKYIDTFENAKDVSSIKENDDLDIDR